MTELSYLAELTQLNNTQFHVLSLNIPYWTHTIVILKVHDSVCIYQSLFHNNLLPKIMC